MKRHLVALGLTATLGATACSPFQIAQWHAANGNPISIEQAEEYHAALTTWHVRRYIEAVTAARAARDAEVHADIVAYLAAVERFGSPEAFAAWVDQLHANLFEYLSRL